MSVAIAGSDSWWITLKTSTPTDDIHGEEYICIHSLIAFIESRIICYGVIKRLLDSV